MSVWINIDYFCGPNRRRAFCIGGRELQAELDIGPAAFSALWSPLHRDEFIQDVVNKCSERWPNIVPAGSAAMGIQWKPAWWGLEIVFTHGSLPVVEEGYECPVLRLNWQNEDGSREYREDV